VARLRARIERAAALHRQAEALVAAAAPVLDAYAPSGAPTEQYAEQHDLAASLRADASNLAPGWLTAPLDALAPTTPLGGPLAPTFVRVGQAHPLDDARFPVVVPLLRAGHVAVDADARDSRVAGLIRSLVLRLLAASPPGSLRVRSIDAAEVGAFTGFSGIDAIMPPPVTDAEGLRALLDEGERWLAARTDDNNGPTLLIVIASLPELTEGRDLARIAALAHAGPAGRLHLIAAGWPPPPLTAETTQAPLPHTTQIAIRNPYVWVGDPPGATFGASGVGPSRLNAPVYLDPDPPAELIRAVCAQLAAPWTAPPMSAREPSRSTWLEYLRAAQRLDAARREAATVVAEHKSALASAREDLSVVRAKLQHHRSRVNDAVQLAGGKSIELAPTWADAQAAQATLASPPAPPAYAPQPPTPVYAGQHTGEYRRIAGVHPGFQPVVPTGEYPRVAAPTSGPPRSPAGPSSPPLGTLPGRVSAALRHTAATLDMSEAELADVPREGPLGRLWTNIVVYGAYAILAALVQLPLLLMADGGDGVVVLAVAGGLVLPVVAFGLGWLTVGALSSRDTPRNPLLGGVISLLALLPLVVLLTGLAFKST
jgi:hypothetical protein